MLSVPFKASGDSNTDQNRGEIVEKGKEGQEEANKKLINTSPGPVSCDSM